MENNFRRIVERRADVPRIGVAQLGRVKHVVQVGFQDLGLLLFLPHDRQEQRPMCDHTVVTL